MIILWWFNRFYNIGDIRNLDYIDQESHKKRSICYAILAQMNLQGQKYSVWETLKNKMYGVISLERCWSAITDMH